MRRALLIALLALLAVPGVAAAQDASIQKAAQALPSDPVYVDPAAAAKVDAGELRRRIQSAGATPTYIAVVPRTSVGPNAAIKQLHSAMRLAGTYILVDGGTLRAGSTDVQGTASAASKAYAAHWPDVQATLDDVVDRVGDIRGGGSSGGGGFGGAGAIVIVALIAIGGFFLLRSRKRGRARQAAEFEEVKENARDDFVALGDDIRALDLDVQMPNAPQAAKDDYAQALECYDRANAIFERARAPEDLAPAAAALEEGRYAMASAKARLQGRRPPERRPPCFFDPRHGPSSREVEWAPGGGAPRMVPACEADAQRVERGEDPQSREILLGGQRMPYWQAGPMYSPFYGGFFSPFGGFGGGGFLPGLFAGTLLGETLGGGFGWGGPGYDTGWGGDGGDWGDGGDF